MRALFSVTNRTDLTALAKRLREIFPEMHILASGGTADALQNDGIQHTLISEITQFPECFGGRIKTLHPAILGGILMRRGTDESEAKRLNIEPIDLVVCNFYHLKNGQEESIDIGGSTLVRAACKNHTSVAVVVDPSDYSAILEEYATQKTLSPTTRQYLARKAMRMSADYERSIVQNLFQEETPHLAFGQTPIPLSYGENPDQKAWLYRFQEEKGIASFPTWGKKTLSYNNYEDGSQAFFALQRIAQEGVVPAVAIVKHGGICGLATGKNLLEAFGMAWEADAKSAYGSIVALSQEVDETFCPLLKGKFIEVVMAPHFSPPFLQWVEQEKPSLRLLQIDLKAVPSHLYRGISGGLLVQTTPSPIDLSDALFQPLFQGKGVATQRHPDLQQRGLFHFALSAVQSVKSNAIVLSREYAPNCYQTVGIGGGQPNRIDSLQRLALPKALALLNKEEERGRLVLASDGFFPFADTLQIAAEAGIRFFIQPGGSVRDEEVIQEADRRGVCMIFTGQRYFSH